MTENFTELVGYFDCIQDGDIITADFPRKLAACLRLMRDDFVLRGLVCNYCDALIPVGDPCCMKCGAPAGRAGR